VVVPRKMLFATDGSAESARAADLAVGLSNGLGSELHLVHVGHVSSVYVPPESKVLDPEKLQDRMRERVEGETRERLEEEVRKIREAGGEVAKAYARFGRADKEIVHLAEELHTDLVIVGSCGFDPIRRAVMGSVSDSVVHYAHCPVLVVR
jgi:nucleotide-binding universal stress UspA family protein